jgi:hypothetical protein
MLANDWGIGESSAGTKKVAQGQIVLCDYNMNGKSKHLFRETASYPARSSIEKRANRPRYTK